MAQTGKKAGAKTLGRRGSAAPGATVAKAAAEKAAAEKAGADKAAAAKAASGKGASSALGKAAAKADDKAAKDEARSTRAEAKSAKEGKAAKGKAAKGRPAGASDGAADKGDPYALGPVERELVSLLAERTGLLPREILERALGGYAAAVAPGLKLPAVNSLGRGETSEHGRPAQTLFLSVDGKPEVEVEKDDFVLGSGPDCDLRLDLPLISPRHARLLWREGRHLFEDLHSTRGSWRHGQQLDVRFLEDGDEIDLGGFLPVRFRIS